MSRFFLYMSILSAGFGGGYWAAPHAQQRTVQRTQKPTPPRIYYTQSEFKFVKAVDGDTLDISDSEGAVTRVRLRSIDTPERGTHHFQAAKIGLEHMCQGKQIKLSKIGDGRYGRISANVTCGKVNVNLQLLALGLAIISIPYADDTNDFAIQAVARHNCDGIWRHALAQNYPPKRLSGKSPIKGFVKFTAHAPCLAP